jgi:hypothetical protein
MVNLVSQQNTEEAPAPETEIEMRDMYLRSVSSRAFVRLFSLSSCEIKKT